MIITNGNVAMTDDALEFEMKEIEVDVFFYSDMLTTYHAPQDRTVIKSKVAELEESHKQVVKKIIERQVE